MVYFLFLFIAVTCFGMHDAPFLQLDATRIKKLDLELAKQLSDSIVSNATKEFAVIRALAKECDREDVGNLEIYNQRLNTYSEKHPLFLLMECDIKSCDHSRGKSTTRSFYEDELSEQLIKQKKDELNMVTFAAGGLFTELVAITKFFKTVVGKTLHIGCIDNAYAPYLALFKKWQQDKIDVSHSATQQIHHFTDTIKTDAQTKKAVSKLLLSMHHRFRQFLTYTNSISNNKCTLTLFADATHYLALTKENPLLQADVLTAIDFEIGPNYFTTVLQYYALLLQNLKRDGVAVLADNQLVYCDMGFTDWLTTNAAVKVHTKKQLCSDDQMNRWLIELANCNAPQRELDLLMLQGFGMIPNPELCAKFKEVDNNAIVSMHIKTSKNTLGRTMADNAPKIVILGVAWVILVVLLYDQITQAFV